MKSLCCGFLFVLAAFSLQAQSLVNHIPKDVMMVMSIHPDALNKKMSLEKIKALQMYEMMLQEMSKSMNPANQQELYDVLKNPSNYGVDLFSGSYVFGNFAEGEMDVNYIFQLNDRSKFRSLLDQYADDEFKNAITKKGDDEMSLSGEGLGLGWNNKMVVFSMSQSTPDYNFSDEEEPVDSSADIKMSVQKNIENILHLSPANSIATVPGYTSLATGPKDMMVWVNYASLMSIYSDAFDMGMGMIQDMPGGAYTGMIMEAMKGLYDGSYMGMKMNFDQGALNMDYDMYMGEKMARYFGGITDNRVDKKFARYIKGNNLLGYFAFSFNVKNLVKGYREMGLDMVKDMPMIGDLSKDALDILSIAIDEEALYNLFTGDMLFAVTGMREFEKMMKTYEYDDDFNQTEVEKMVKQSLPEFTMMMSYGNKADLMKFIRLGLHTSVIQSEGNYFKASVPDLPMDIYMAMKDGIFFVSNNTDLVRNHLDKGYSKKERLSKKHCKTLQKHPMVFYWDVPLTMQAAAELSPQAAGMLNAERSPVREVSFKWDPIKGRMNHSSLNIDFTDKSRNSLEVLLQLMEESLPMLMSLGM